MGVGMSLLLKLFKLWFERRMGWRERAELMACCFAVVNSGG